MHRRIRTAIRHAQGRWSQAAQPSRSSAEGQQVPFDSPAAMASAHIRTHLEARGISIGTLDLLIAGTALSHAALLVTSNAREFSRAPGLGVVDWRSANGS
jgi:predicted nucleic acid-binding protein